MRAAVAPLPRFAATPTNSKHRLFVWLDGSALPNHHVGNITAGKSYQVTVTIPD